MEFPKADTVDADIKTFLQEGFFSFMSSDEGLETGMERFQAAYASSWKDLKGHLIDKTASWREDTSPREQLETIFSRIFDLRGTELENRLSFGLLIREKHPEEPMIHDVLYDGKGSDVYDDETILKEIEEICWVAGFSEQPRTVAEWIMNYIMVVHMTYKTMPAKDPKDNLSREEAIQGLRMVFDKFS